MKATKKKSPQKTIRELRAEVRDLRTNIQSLHKQSSDRATELSEAGLTCNCTYYCECGLRKLGL